MAGQGGGGGAQPAPLVVESQRYEEWMKIATDNVSLAVFPRGGPEADCCPET